MAFLDGTAYDLTTEDGQAGAISDIIDELNSTPQDSDLLNYLNIATYGTLSVTVPKGQSGEFLASKPHGLGYKPAFSVLLFDDSDPSNPAYETIPSLGFTTGPPISNINKVYAYCDSQNIYASFNIPAPNNFPIDLTNQLFYYIFNLPMPT